MKSAGHPLTTGILLAFSRGGRRRWKCQVSTPTNLFSCADCTGVELRLYFGPCVIIRKSADFATRACPRMRVNTFKRSTLLREFTEDQDVSALRRRRT